MNNTETKALEQASKLLTISNTHEIYQGVQDILEKNGITDNAVKIRIKDAVFNLVIDSQKPYKEAKNWIDALIEDNKNKT